LVDGVCLLIVGRLSDIAGRRYFLIGAQVICIVGAVVCGCAKNISTVIAGSVLLGISSAVQTLYTLYIQELVPNKHRSYGMGAISLGAIPTLGLGPAIARAFVSNPNLGWR
jgi:MFS family permease